MCGLTGFWQWRGGAESDLMRYAHRMNDDLSSRGPDGSGVWVSATDGLALAHRRLSIIDLTDAGSQPMVSSSGRFVIVFNGEVYNADSLRKQLKDQGVVFRGHSDTEVLLEGCALWGVEPTLQKLVGMFAFVLWDKHNKSLTLARDRFGIKPLYWGISEHTLFFGSQIKSFFSHPSWRGVLDKKTLSSYFHYGYYPDPLTPFQGMYKLPPAHMMTIDKNRHIQKVCYWSLHKMSMGADLSSAKVALEHVHTLAAQAVEDRLVSDVPVGAFLSGGVDSSFVVSLMRHIGHDVKAYAIGMEVDIYDEAPYAKAIAEHLGVKISTHYLKAKEAQQVVMELPEIYDEPFADSSAIPTYIVSRFARQDVTVCLSGDGGDEVFIGYDRYLKAHKILAFLEKYPRWLRLAVMRVLRIIPAPAWAFIERTLGSRIGITNICAKIDKLWRILSSQHADICMLYDEFVRVSSHAFCDKNFLMCDVDSEDTSIYRYMQLCDMRMYLPGDILTKVDRASMAFGLEVRVPLLDHRLVEYAFSLPERFHVEGENGKVLLKQLLSRYVPSDLFQRPKKGFGVPLDRWLKEDLRPWAEKHILAAKRDGILSPHKVATAWHNYVEGKENNAHGIWSILMFQAWKEHYGSAIHDIAKPLESSQTTE